MSTYQRWCHLNGGKGELGVSGKYVQVWGVLWEKEGSLHGTILTTKDCACSPSILCAMV